MHALGANIQLKRDNRHTLNVQPSNCMPFVDTTKCMQRSKKYARIPFIQCMAHKKHGKERQTKGKASKDIQI